jgi:tripartite-type tricarboxylate transporter receptor subunit TctC
LTRIPDELPVEPHTPDAIIGKLNEAINAGLADPKMKARVADLGGTALEVLASGRRFKLF